MRTPARGTDLDSTQLDVPSKTPAHIQIRKDASRGGNPTFTIRSEFGDLHVTDPRAYENLSKLFHQLPADQQQQVQLRLRRDPDIMQVIGPENLEQLNQKLTNEDQLKLQTPACGEASGQLRSLGVPEDISSHELRNPDTPLQKQLDWLMKFDGRCLRKLKPPEYPDQAPGWVQQTKPDRVLGILVSGIRGNAVPDPFCTGVLISSNQVLTARHCFYHRETAAPESGRKSGIEAGNIGFALVQPPHRIIPILAEAKPPDEHREYFASAVQLGRAYGVAHDLLILVLAQPVVDAPKVELRVAHQSEELWLAGPFEARLLSSPNDASKEPDPYAVRWTGDGVCQIVAADDQCLQHSCQTIGEFSGAPVFGAPLQGEPPDQISIVGMHVGAAGSGGCEGVDAKLGYAGGLGNLALSGPYLTKFIKGWK